MSIHGELVAELQRAMRAKDRPCLNVVRQIESEVSVASSAPGFKGEVDDALYLAVIRSYVKKVDKARREYETLGERGAEHAQKLRYEIDFLSRWLPTTLGIDDTLALVNAAIAELGAEDPKMIGGVIRHIMQSGAGVDGGLVARLVKEAFAS
jgi:uncharacterized protein YqeY